jgi:hypothetical protein
MNVLENVLGALAFFYISAIFVAMGVMGVMQYRKAEKENHPFVSIIFATLPIILPVCLGFAFLFAFIGFQIITQ